MLIPAASDGLTTRRVVHSSPEQQGLLLFAYYFPPANTSGAQRPFRFAKYLRSHNFQAHVITSSPQGEDAPWKNVREVPGRTEPSLMAAIGAQLFSALQRVLPYNDQLPWVSHAASAAGRVVSETRPVAMLSTSPPVACHAAALLTKWRFGIPWIADFRDPFYANPLRPRKLSRPYEALLEGLIVSNADAIIANTEHAGDLLRRRYGRFEKKIHVIWNGYDPEEPLAALPLPKRDQKVLMHAGTLYGGRHPGALVASLDRLIERGVLNPDRVRLRLIGWMENTSVPWTSQPAFQALRDRGCLEYISEVIPQPEAVREMAEADGLLLLDLNDTGQAVQVPAKLFQYVRIGRPILAFTSPDSPSERILKNCGVPYVTVYPNASDEQIDQRVASFFELSSEPTRPSPWFEEQFNGEGQTRVLASILQHIIS